jgi:D-glycero-D-manno-heptose 1,7-bisphosphate phosphatase
MKVAFIDRDGVINKEVEYLHQVKDFEYTNNCISGLQSLISSGFSLVVVTNQAGIARGLYSTEDYLKLTDWMVDDLKRHGVSFLDILFCPHHPKGVVPKYTRSCYCRKPSPGMFINARDRFDIDMESSIVIGDKESDVHAAASANVGRLFLVRSGHSLSQTCIAGVSILDDLFAVACLLEEENRSADINI